MIETKSVASAGFRPCVLLCLLTFLLTPPGAATILVEEPFNYSLGEINGVTANAGGTVGLTGTWNANVNATQIVPQVLTYSVPGFIGLGGSPALEVARPGNDTAHVALGGSGVNLDSIYVGFLFKFAGTPSNNELLELWLDTVTQGNHNTAALLGVRVNSGPGGADFYATSDGSQGRAYSPTQLQANSTYFLLMRIYKSVPGAGNVYNAVSLWVNPTGYDVNNPQVSMLFNGGHLSEFAYIGFRGQGWDRNSSDVVWVDNLLITDSWGDIFREVPEPGTLSLVGLASVIFGLRILLRRRDA